MSIVSANIDEDRLDNGTFNGADKRASVLSFQTARSNGGDYDDGRESQSFTSAPASEMEVLDKALPPRPWLSQGIENAPSGSSSFNSSIDERHLPPGGWGNTRSWSNGADDARGPTVRSSPPTSRKHISTERRNSPSMSPKLRLTSLNEPVITPSLATSLRTPPSAQPISLPTQEQRAARPTSMLRNDTTEDLLSAQSLGLTSGPSTLDTPLDPRSSTILPRQAGKLSGQHEKDWQTSNLVTQQANTQPPDSDGGTTADNVAPAVPEKASPPLIPTKDEVGLSSPPLSDNVIPAPLPVSAEIDVASIPSQMPIDRAPVADFRRTPLAAMTKDNNGEGGIENMAREVTRDTVQQKGASRPRSASAAGLIAAAGAAAATATTIAVSTIAPSGRVGPGVGAHAARHSGADQTAAPAFAALMRRPSNGAAPRTVVPRAITPTPLDESSSPSIDTPPREDSPPPEGEVEARAEWERAQMRQMAEKAKRASGAPRKTTFRGQLKPLQLVQHEETKRSGKSSPKRGSPVQLKGAMLPESPREDVRDLSGPSAAGTVSRSASGGSAGLNTMAASNSTGLPPSNGKSGGGLSTQQLQRQLARDQRRSVSAVNMTMGQMGVGDIGGAYPVFPSPSASPSIVMGGSRQYPGLMPQRSLVPPFELQNRPDGLPSALIGPDGVRRSPNDPEVCLECMMRDEDMIDVHVLGASLWERESDLDFAEAIRLESLEDAKREKRRAAEAAASTGTNYEGIEGSGNVAGGGKEEGSVATKEAATAAVGSLSASYPRLTKIRVKRVASGEPLTAERLKLHTQMNPPASSHRWRTLQTFLAIQAKYIAIEQKARGIAPPAVPPKSAMMTDNAMVKTPSSESRLLQRQRVASPGLFQVEEVPPTAEQKGEDVNDVAGGREARKGNNVSLGLGAATDPAVVAEDVGEKRLSGPPVMNDNSSGHHSIPRRTNAGPGTYVRAGSIQDLRTLPNSMAAKKDTLQPITVGSSNNLAPPHASFRGPSSPHSPRGFGSSRMRTVSSQMSLANSGSMIDMHVGLENSKEHRIAQAGFMPGTPLHSQSPGAINRAFYGFPGDGQAEHAEDWSIGRGFDQSMGTSFGEYDDSYRSSPELERKKKKSSGFRGFFGKITGKEAGELRPEDESMESRDRRYSMRPDSSLELQPPPGIGGLLSRARRSTSSLLMPSGRQSMDSTMMLGGDRGFSNPLMASQTSLEMGPFGSGPLPPPRKDSKLPTSSPAPKEKEKSRSRLRAFSSGNLLSKKKPPNPTNRTSSMLQTNSVQNIGTPLSPSGGEEQDLYDRGNAASRLSNGREQQSAKGPRDASPSMRVRDIYQTQDGQPIRTSIMQNNTPHSQFRNPFPQSMNRSDVYLPESVIADARDDSGNPVRPPRNPSRVSMSQPSSEHPVEYMDGSAQNKSAQLLHIPTSLQKEQFYHSYETPPTPEAVPRMRDPRQEQQQQHRTSTFGLASLPPGQPTSSASPPSRKSKLLKLPFGKNKRESAALSVATTKETNSLKSRSSRATFDDNAAYYAVPQSNGTTSHQQRGVEGLRANAARSQHDSNASYDFPPRSQSAMGMLDANQAQGQANGLRGFLPRLRTNSRAALRDVQED